MTISSSICFALFYDTSLADSLQTLVVLTTIAPNFYVIIFQVAYLLYARFNFIAGKYEEYFNDSHDENVLMNCGACG